MKYWLIVNIQTGKSIRAKGSAIDCQIYLDILNWGESFKIYKCVELCDNEKHVTEYLDVENVFPFLKLEAIAYGENFKND